MNVYQEIVKELNEELYEQLEEDSIDISYKTNGYVEIIDFIGIQIWNSECDELFEDDLKTQLKNFLIKKIQEIVDIIKKIKF